ncbi:MAG: sortase [Acidimicrobiales bacterium]|jgi:sortase A
MSVTDLNQPTERELARPLSIFTDDEEANRVEPPEAITPLAVTSSPAPGRVKHSALENLGLCLTLAGVVLLLFAGYLFGWSDLQVAHNQHRLLTTYAVGTCPTYVPSCAAEYAAFDGVAPPDGKAAAVLQIPQLGLRAVVVEGTTASDLQQGPGLMPATSIPGSAGEAVIAGRKLTFGGAFAHLSDLRPGDTIDVVDFLGAFRFVVDRSFEVPPGQSLPVLHSNLGLLALVTSAQAVPPSGFDVVEASLVGNPVPAPHRPPGPTVQSELSLSGDSAGLAGLIGWGVALVVLLIGTVVAYRRTGRVLLVYVLSTPILLPVALFTFQNAARLLPATM